MSDQLPQHELELMNLFDRDLTQKERDRLIELLSTFPELSDKYAFYLHLQDLELNDLPQADPKVRRQLLRMAVKETHKIKFAAKAQAFINWLIHPLVAAPATLCLVFLVGYELMDSTQSSQNSLMSDHIERAPLAEEQNPLESQEELEKPPVSKMKPGAEINSAVIADGAKKREKKKLRLTTTINKGTIVDGIVGSDTKAPLKERSSKVADAYEDKSTRRSRSAEMPIPQAKRLQDKTQRKGRVNPKDLINQLTNVEHSTDSVGDIFGESDTAMNNTALIGSGPGSDGTGSMGSSRGGGGSGLRNAMSTQQVKGRLGGRRAARRTQSKKRSVNQKSSRQSSPPTLSHKDKASKSAGRPRRLNGADSPPSSDDLLFAVENEAVVDEDLPSEAVQPQPSTHASTGAKAMEGNTLDAASPPLNQTERTTLRNAKRDLNLRSSESVTLLRLARLALRANDLAQASSWTEWVIRRNDKNLRAALELQRQLQRLKQRNKPSE